MRETMVITEASQAAMVIEPIKAQILEILRTPATTAQLAKRLRQPRQRLGYHVRQLEQAGLLELAGTEKNRNCLGKQLQAVAQKFYLAPGSETDDAALKELRDRFSSAWLVMQSTRSAREVSDLAAAADRAGKKLPTLSIDTTVAFDTIDEQQVFAQELTELVAALAARYTSDSGAARHFRLIAASYPKPAETTNTRSRRH